MSWFYHVSHSSNQQEPSDMIPNTTANNMPSTQYCSNIRGATLFTSGTARVEWPCTSPSLMDFPSTPQGSAPPRLENLSCTSLNAGAGREHMPTSYVTLQEQRCVLSWFLSWGGSQKERFMQDLLGKAVPGKVCTLLESLNTLQVVDRAPNIFECQLRLWTQWFESWSEEERNSFLHLLEEQDPIFVGHFYKGIAGTAGRD
ncbi:uncharacterized protein C14orf119 homolog isoform 1-T1 [Aplochiton taeniatus]